LAGPIAGDPVADLVKAAKLLDIEVDHLAGAGALIATHGLSRLQITHPVQSKPSIQAAAGYG
jgi:16S rRNA C1402 (ribose-2'-O) methylase RsmI